MNHWSWRTKSPGSVHKPHFSLTRTTSAMGQHLAHQFSGTQTTSDIPWQHLAHHILCYTNHNCDGTTFCTPHSLLHKPQVGFRDNILHSTFSITQTTSVIPGQHLARHILCYTNNRCDSTHLAHRILCYMSTSQNGQVCGRLSYWDRSIFLILILLFFSPLFPLTFFCRSQFMMLWVFLILN